MKNLASVLSLLSVCVNMLTMMYVEFELADVITSSSRLAVTGGLVVMVFGQVICLRRRYSKVA